ncbi:hypothetical protein [uncultured Paraglaciecola sp.]|uniref:hypothetical protein n=1 Tax=uncultured Paraglaciecola sp. TaxID=1765024 RepID=UPI00260BA02D|nr:hypothetical protein [uncultured Paraglaciecola sp.]
MANLDPFVIQWPERWVSDPEIGPVVYYLNRFLHDIFVALDGGTAVEDAEVINSSTKSRLASLMQSIDDISMQNSNRSEIAILSERISDLEKQQ